MSQAVPFSEANSLEEGTLIASDLGEMLDFEAALQMTDNQQICVGDVVSFFETELSRMAPRSAAMYRRAVESFRKSSRPGRPFDDSAIEHWLTSMAIDGIKLTTATYYLENIRALCNKVRKAGYSLPDIAIRAAEQPAAEKPAELPALNLTALERLAADSRAVAAPFRIAADLLLFSLACGGLDVESIVAMPAQQLDSLPPAACDIARGYEFNRRRYVFPLGQGRRTNRRIAADIIARMEAVDRSYDLRCGSFDRDGMRRLWVAFALASGAAPSMIMASVGAGQRLNSALMLVSPAEYFPEELAGIQGSLVDNLTRRPARWHVMRMNRGIEPQNILDSIEQAGLELPSVYYPTETIARRREHRIEQQTKPVLPRILFFRATKAQVAPIMAAVSEYAHILRLTSSPSSPYATVSNASMYAFQVALAQLTPDMQQASAAAQIVPGAQVDIIAGTMEGYRGVVSNILPDVDGMRVFELKICSDFGFEWTAGIPEIHLRPL